MPFFPHFPIYLNLLPEFYPVLITLLTLMIFNIIGFLFLFNLFGNLYDRGFALAKIMTLVSLGYVIWLFSSLKIIHFTHLNVILVLLIMLCLSLIIYLRQHQDIKDYLSRNWRLLLFEEFIFCLFFFSFLIIRFFNPDLWHPVMGGEKPMDFAFLNAIIKSETFPPYDPWYSGLTINYYYYGQYLVAVLIKLMNIKSSIFYNIALSYFFAQSAVAVFSIVFNITASKFFGLAASSFLLLIGNLGQITLIIKTLFLKQILPINAWYWTSTRIMPNNEINEFPFFSFLYADLHSHLLALPVAIFVIAVLVSLVVNIKQDKEKERLFIVKLILLSLLLGTLRAANVWDYPSYLLVSGCFILFVFFFRKNRNIYSAFKIILSMVLVLLLSNFFFLPFVAGYQTGPLGLGIYKDAPTRLQDYFVINGFFIAILLYFVIASIDLKKIFYYGKFKHFLLTAFSFSFLLVNQSVFVIFLSFVFFLLALAFISLKDEKTEGRIIILILSSFAFSFTLIPDIFELKVGLGRMNTVFKYYFQAWLFFATASGISLFYLYQDLKQKGKITRFFLYFLFAILLLSSFSYIPTATYAKIMDRMYNKSPKTLDGTLYMRDSVYYDQGEKITLLWDYQAISWINDNLRSPAVFLEANTPTYRWGSRISIYTGFPTVIGWEWHEKAHRSYLSPLEIDKRVADVKQAYETTSPEEFLSLAKKYRIKYVYLGELEKAYYKGPGLTKFTQGRLTVFLEAIYKNEGVVIYKLKNG